MCEAQEPFVCATCGFTFFQNTAAAVAGIIYAQGRVLFTVRAKAPQAGKLDLPGGFVDRNEDLESALSREVNEELGIHIPQWQYLCSGINDYPYKDVMYQTCDAIYVSVLPDKPEIRLQESEIRDCVWLATDDINLSDIAFGSLQIAVKKFVSSL